MTNRRASSVTASAVRQAQSLGIHGDAETRLLRMAKRSAPITHPQGNRRFENYVLRIEDGTITQIVQAF